MSFNSEFARLIGVGIAGFAVGVLMQGVQMNDVPVQGHILYVNQTQTSCTGIDYTSRTTLRSCMMVAQALHEAASEEVSSEAPAVLEAKPVEPGLEVPKVIEHMQPEKVQELDSFPAFDHAIMPVSRIPNWGAMKTPAEWNKTYAEMDKTQYVPVPTYDMKLLTQPIAELAQNRDDQDTIHTLTTKLFYSTRFFGSYNLDSAEFTAIHPGIDLKLPIGTPLMSIAGGRVSRVGLSPDLGIYVEIELHLNDEAFYAIYGHLGSATVQKGQDVKPGEVIGYVGMTGNTSAPHLHLQIDKGEPGEVAHVPFLPRSMPSQSEALRHVVHPIGFIASH